MPPTDTDEGIRVAAAVRETHPEIGVVVLSQYAESAYVLKPARGGLRAARLPAQGARPPPRAAGRRRARRAARAARTSTRRSSSCSCRAAATGADSPLAALTPRELETLAEIAQGKSNEAIAQSLVLTKRAVEKHINAIFMKLNLAGAPDV